LEDGIWWVQWPFLGWGLGVALHAWAVYGTTPNFIAKWQLRKIKELKDKM
jgi:2TM domain